MIKTFGNSWTVLEFFVTPALWALKRPRSVRLFILLLFLQVLVHLAAISIDICLKELCTFKFQVYLAVLLTSMMSSRWISSCRLCRPFFKASVFAKLLSNDPYGRISVMHFFNYVMRKVWLHQTRIGLSLYDVAGLGYLRESVGFLQLWDMNDYSRLL